MSATVPSRTNSARNSTGLVHSSDGSDLSDGSVRSARTLPGKPQRPATQTESKLLAVWEEVFGIDGLGVVDDYFALGGTSLLAARLFMSIAQNFNVRLPLSTIIEAPTVRTLSRYLDQPPGAITGRSAAKMLTQDIKPLLTQRSTSLVELKRGGSRNLFLVHDGDGETLLYLNLARRMPANLSVTGIEPLRIPNVPLAQLTIEEMAAFYVGEIRRSQPNGPYLLGGLCAGGVIAFEMASQLVRSGEGVELVALLETATPGASKRAGLVSGRRIGRLRQALTDACHGQRSLVARMWILLSTISRKLVNMLTWEIMQRGTRWSVSVRFRLLRYLRAHGLPWLRILPGLSVRQIYALAEAVYVPKRLYHTHVVLARARAGVANDIPHVDDTAYVEIYADDTFGWGQLTERLVVVDVDGGHSSMLQEPFVECLSTALIAQIDTPVSIWAPRVETEIV